MTEQDHANRRVIPVTADQIDAARHLVALLGDEVNPVIAKIAAARRVPASVSVSINDMLPTVLEEIDQIAGGRSSGAARRPPTRVAGQRVAGRPRRPQPAA